MNQRAGSLIDYRVFAKEDTLRLITLSVGRASVKIERVPGGLPGAR